MDLRKTYRDQDMMEAAAGAAGGGGAAGGAAGGSAGGGGAGGGSAAGGGAAGGGPTTTAVGAARDILGITDSAALTQILSWGTEGIHTASRESCIAALAREKHRIELALEMLMEKPDYKAEYPSDVLDTLIRESPWKNFGDEFIATMNIYLRGDYLEIFVGTEYEVPDSPEKIAKIIKLIFKAGWREADKLEIITKNVLQLLGQDKTPTELFPWFHEWSESPHYPEFTASPAL